MIPRKHHCFNALGMINNKKFRQLGMARPVAMPLRMSRSTANVMHTKLKCTKIYLGYFDRVYENLHLRKFPAIYGSPYCTYVIVLHMFMHSFLLEHIIIIC